LLAWQRAAATKEVGGDGCGEGATDLLAAACAVMVTECAGWAAGPELEHAQVVAPSMARMTMRNGFILRRSLQVKGRSRHALWGGA
jgi:hypothetical protein